MTVLKYVTVLTALVGIAALNSETAKAEEQLDIADENVRINYSLGYQIGGDFKRQNVEINAAAVVKGIEDALAGVEPLMGQDEMHATLVELKRKVTEQQRETRRRSELQMIEEGKQFVAEYAASEDVQKTESGLLYRVIEEGTGRVPGATDEVTVNYVGRLVNGNEFDSGDDISFPLNSVIKGWTEGLQLIREGGEIELVIPPELAYGNRGAMGHRTLVFEVELLTVQGPKAN